MTMRNHYFQNETILKMKCKCNFSGIVVKNDFYITHCDSITKETLKGKKSSEELAKLSAIHPIETQKLLLHQQ